MNAIGEARKSLQNYIEQHTIAGNAPDAKVLAQLHAAIAQAEAQTRIAECLETMLDEHTPGAGCDMIPIRWDTKAPAFQSDTAASASSEWDEYAKAIRREGQRNDAHKMKVRGLAKLISELSEEATCAEWHSDCEYIVWAELEDDLTPPFRLIRDPGDANRLRSTSADIGGWVAWDESEGDAVYVPMLEWQRRYAEWREKAWRNTSQGGAERATVAACLRHLDDQFGDATPDPLADLAPDWSEAPDWAQWYAIDDDGGCFWYAEEPRAMSNQWIPRVFPTRHADAGIIGWTMADWRQCKWQRPQAQEAARPDWLTEWRGG